MSVPDLSRRLLWTVGLVGLLAAGCDTTAKVSFPNRTFNAAYTSGFIAPQGQCQSFGTENGGTAKLRFAMIDDDNVPLLPGGSIEGGAVSMNANSVELTSGRLFSAPDLTCGGETDSSSSNLRPPGPLPAPDGGIADVGDAGDVADTGTADSSAMDTGAEDTGSMDTASMDTGGTEDTGMRTADAMTDGGGMGNGNGGGTQEGTYAGEILQYDGVCTDPYECQTAKEGAGARCLGTTNYDVQSVSHVAESGDQNVLGVLVENSRSMEGWYPAQTTSWYYDEDADGETDLAVSPNPEEKIATDDNERRMSELNTLVGNWETIQEYSDRKGGETRFGLWSIDGERPTPKITSYVAENGGPDHGFALEPATVSSAVTEFRNETVDGTKIANVYESMYSVVTENFADEKFEEYEKTMLVMVDGPPDRPRPGARATGEMTVENIIQEAQEQNIRIFIVHLDPSLTLREDQSGESVKLLHDDPDYWDGQSESGSCSDGACKNFESCRKVHGYSDLGLGEEADMNGDGKTWCMPQRQPDGRLGPIREYGRIACATKGGYLYVKSTEDLGRAMEWIPYSLDGLWEAEVTVENAAVQQYTEPTDAMRLQSTIGITPAKATETIDLSQVGGVAGEEPGSGDTRSVLFTGTEN